MLAGVNLVARAARLSSSTQPGVAPTVPVHRILVIELWKIGDVILTIPFLRQLRRLFPDGAVSMLAQPHAKELLGHTGLVDEFLEIDLAWTDSAVGSALEHPWLKLLPLRHRLHAGDFDVAFQCRLHVREHLIVALSGAKRRVGYGFGRGDRALTDPIPVGDPNRHKTDDWLGLLAPFGGHIGMQQPPIVPPEPEGKWAGEYLESAGIPASDILIGVHPGASVEGKRWPLRQFEETAASLATRSAVSVIAFTEPGGYGASLGQLPGVKAVSCSLRQLMALISRCSVLICNDSGPMHLAGALGVPTVAIFASGIGRLFSPLGDGHDLVSPDRDGLPISSISVSRVMAGVDRVLERRRSL